MQIESYEGDMIVKVTYQVDGGCVLCLMCYYECPVRAIEIIEDVSAKINPELCIGCGKCYKNCQGEAIIKVEN